MIEQKKDLFKTEILIYRINFLSERSRNVDVDSGAGVCVEMFLFSSFSVLKPS